MMLNMYTKPSAAPVRIEVGMAATMDDVMRNRVMMGRFWLQLDLLRFLQTGTRFFCSYIGVPFHIQAPVMFATIN